MLFRPVYLVILKIEFHLNNSDLEDIYCEDNFVGPKLSFIWGLARF